MSDRETHIDGRHARASVQHEREPSHGGADLIEEGEVDFPGEAVGRAD